MREHTMVRRGAALRPAPRGRPTRVLAIAVLALVAGLPLAGSGPAWGQNAAPAGPSADAPAAPAASSAASAQIGRLHAQLLAVMKRAEELGYEGREERLAEVIPRFFDIDFMARKSLGRHWREADEAEQKRFLETFQRFMVANYAGRFDGWSGQSFETLGQEPARLDTVIVRSRIVDPEDENVDLNYRMREVDGSWRIIDVYLDGTVSELALRRSEFVSIVKREDFDALLVALDEKIRKLAAGEES